MMLVRFFDWFLLAALFCLLCLGAMRMVALRARGIRVVVIERNRTVVQDMLDRVQVLSLLFLAYEIVAYAWPLPAQLVPPWLDTILVDTRGELFEGQPVRELPQSGNNRPDLRIIRFSS